MSTDNSLPSDEYDEMAPAMLSLEQTIRVSVNSLIADEAEMATVVTSAVSLCRALQVFATTVMQASPEAGHRVQAGALFTAASVSEKALTNQFNLPIVAHGSFKNPE